jgi:hypothetical protein
MRNCPLIGEAETRCYVASLSWVFPLSAVLTACRFNSLDPSALQSSIQPASDGSIFVSGTKRQPVNSVTWTVIGAASFIGSGLRYRVRQREHPAGVPHTLRTPARNVYRRGGRRLQDG